MTTCSEFAALTNIYTIAYICYNYDIYCDNSCINDITTNCYCYCDSNQIYCYSRYYYYSRFFSVLMFALFVAIICSCLYMCICNHNIHKQNLKQNLNKNYPVQQIQEIHQTQENKNNPPEYKEKN